MPRRRRAAAEPPVQSLGHDAFRLQALTIAGVALALRLLHVWQLRGSPFFDVLMGDARGYDEWARRIAGGEWIGHEVFYQAPLYPYFLGVIYAAVGHSLTAVRLVQAMLGAASCVLVALAARRLFTPRVGLVAGLALAIYAPAIFFDGLIQKSVLDVVLIALGVWLIAILVDTPDRRGAWIGLGLAMGALSLTRENALVFIVVILAWCFWREVGRNRYVGRGVGSVQYVGRGDQYVGRGFSRGFQRSLFFLAGLAIVLMPVAVRNYSVGGGFYLTTSQFGPNFYIGNNPRADGTYMSLRFGRGAPEYERQDATDLAQHALGRTLTPAEVSSYWTDRAMAFITGEPAAWLRLMARKALLLISASEMVDTESQESYAEWSWPLRFLGWFGHFGVLIPLAAAGAVLAWSDRRRLAVLYAMAACYAASVTLFYVFARYRQPLVPLLLPFAALTLVRAGGWIAAFRPSTRAQAAPSAVEGRTSNTEPRTGTSNLELHTSHLFAAGCWLLLIVASNWRLLSVPTMKAITETNLATALQDAGQSEAAIAHYQRAIAIEPSYAPAYNNLGVVLRARGRVDEAIQAYQQALRVNGDYPDAHYNLANALLDANRPTEAADHFTIALKTIPDSAGARNNLGIALAAQGRNEDAIAAFRAAVAAEPASAKAHKNLGDALSSAGRTAEAVDELTRAASLDPNDAGTHYNLGVVLLEAGRAPDASLAFRRSLAINPRSAEAHNNLGIAYAQTGQLQAAVDEFQLALAINPAFADAQRNLMMARQAISGLRR